MKKYTQSPEQRAWNTGKVWHSEIHMHALLLTLRVISKYIDEGKSLRLLCEVR